MNLPKTAGIAALQAFAATAGSPADQHITKSYWRTNVDRGEGSDLPNERGDLRSNVFNSTGNGYNELAMLLGSGPSFLGSFASGQNTSATANTLVNTGAPFVASALIGRVVVCTTVGTGGALVWGVILANTTTTLTVDQWYNPGVSTGAAGTTPNGSSNWYCVLPNGAAAAWMAVGSTVISPGAGDTSLTGELTANGFLRAPGSYVYVAAASTYTLAHLWTSATTVTINGEAQFNCAYYASAAGYMVFESSEPTPPSLLSGDTITNTVTVTI